MNYLFPVAFAWNTFAMTALMVILGISGQSHLAADVGIIQGAAVALFLSFSANSRSIILNPSTQISIESIVWTRLTLLLPLALAAYVLCLISSDASAYLAIALIVRRCAEWISEIHLSEMELLQDGLFARYFIYIQVFTFAGAVFCLLYPSSVTTIGLFIWALAPILMSLGFIREKLKKISLVTFSWRLMYPQFGSTMIIGVSLYFFRLIIILVAGKGYAGDLFTAFALGGVVGSAFAQILGPSVVLYESQKKKTYFTLWTEIVLAGFCLGGVILFCAAYTELGILISLGKSADFWLALGASMVGGVVMVYAQHFRFKILQTHDEANLFGPDVYANIIVLACIPFLYYIAGSQSLTILYLISAVLSYAIYRSVNSNIIGSEMKSAGKNYHISATLISMFIILPIFFQMEGGILRNPDMIFDSNGLISKLPIPISVLGCFAGIVIIGNFRRANISLGVIFLSFVTMLFTSLISTYHQDEATKAKLFFLLQFILPMFALILGQQFEELDPKLERLKLSYLSVMCFIVPLQLIATYMQGRTELAYHVFLFSIYQHWEYVPVILTSAFLFVFIGTWDVPRYRLIMMIAIVVIAVYVGASNSAMALVFLYVGLLAAIYEKYRNGKICRTMIYFTIIAAVLSFGYINLYKTGNSAWQKIQILEKDSSTVLNVKMNVSKSRSLTDRFTIWKIYAEGSMKDVKTFLLGNPQRPSRNISPSAHNYYLDYIYNYGFISVLPLIGLIWITLRRLYKTRKEVMASSDLFGLAIVVLLLLFADNQMKVGLRQPYPGIFTFFMWGILVSKLIRLNSVARSNRSNTEIEMMPNSARER